MDGDTGTLTQNDNGSRNGTRPQPIVEKRDIYQDVEDLKLSLAVQSATHSGALATQAATQSGALATASAAQTGANTTMSAMQAGQAATTSAVIMGIWSTLAAGFIMLTAGIIVGSYFNRR